MEKKNDSFSEKLNENGNSNNSGLIEVRRSSNIPTQSCPFGKNCFQINNEDHCRLFLHANVIKPEPVEEQVRTPSPLKLEISGKKSSDNHNSSKNLTLKNGEIFTTTLKLPEEEKREKPNCPNGNNCYQNSQDHNSRYAHPWDKKKKRKMMTKKALHLKKRKNTLVLKKVGFMNLI